eukprot:COSAG02_NODE_27388_length_611_cov_0.597656_1_plen_71_part_01
MPTLTECHHTSRFERHLTAVYFVAFAVCDNHSARRLGTLLRSTRYSSHLRNVELCVPYRTPSIGAPTNGPL